MRTRGAERSVEVQVGPLFGVDVRPSRVFVWAGPERRRQRIVSFGQPPRLLRLARRRRCLTLGPVTVTALGNPLVTLGRTGLTLTRALASGRRSPVRRLLP